jgi:L,D-transpeptidase catalytic domain
VKKRVLYAFLTFGLAGCGGGSSDGVLGAERTTCAPAVVKAGSTSRAVGAAAERALWVYDRPGGRRLERFGRLNANGVPTVFGVVARAIDARCRATWYRVRLPRRPNHRVAWVRADDVTVGAVRTRILVDLSARRVTLYRSGRAVLSSRAAIGSSATPTPTGSFYVNQRLIPIDPNGPFGPGAVGISAFSNVLTGWMQGGPIAIHGTNAPWSIGKAVSNGCIRLPNPVLRKVFAEALNGTPVLIRN